MAERLERTYLEGNWSGKGVLPAPAVGTSRWTRLDVITDLATHDSYPAAQVFGG